MRARHILLGALVALGCSDLTAPTRLAGVWEQDSSIPGSGMNVALSTNGDSVSGTGRWYGEACCSGTVTVTGAVRRGEVNLVFAFVSNGGIFFPPSTSNFAGQLISANTLSGSFVALDGSTRPTTFRRTQ